MGYLQPDIELQDIHMLKSQLKPYPENDYIRGLIYKHVLQYPYKKVDLKELISAGDL
ncbi:MAG: hypothetical protein ABIN48_15100 [Ginsengibacter sp.]